MLNPNCWLEKIREWQNRRKQLSLEKQERELKELQEKIKKLEAEEKRLRIIRETLETRRELKRQILEHKEALRTYGKTTSLIGLVWNQKTKEYGKKALEMAWREVFGSPKNE